MVKGDDIEDRMVDYAVRVIRLSKALPDSIEGQHIRGQLLRSGTSPAPNYGEARSAESKRDFQHKLRIVLKELNESRIWLKVIVRSQMLPEEQLTPLMDETDQLCKIINASIQTARKNT